MKAKLSNTSMRIVAAVVMIMIAAIAAMGQYYGFPAVRWLGCAVVALMILEYVGVLWRHRATALTKKNAVICIAFLGWLIVMLRAIYVVGNRPWIILLMLMTIAAADIGAWFFGKMLGGDKMWERLSSGKTWSGQIAGILCGTLAAIMYGLLGTDTFMPQLMWIGISMALMSQYGDLTASMIKRRIGIKDFGNIIPGHGGVLDRFDGWIYVLPIVWMVTL